MAGRLRRLRNQGYTIELIHDKENKRKYVKAYNPFGYEEGKNVTDVYHKIKKDEHRTNT